MNNKYNTFLTVLLIIIIIAIVGIIGFLGYKYISAVNSKKEAENFTDSWNNGDISQNNKKDDKDDGDLDITVPDEGNNEGDGDNSSEQNPKEERYNGFLIAGTIEIPTTKLKCPILSRSEYSKSALETSVVEFYGPGLNQVGNTCIAGHNFRNGNFFSDNKKLKVGDKIYITDLTKKKVSYTIYSKYETTETDAEYMSRDTEGAVEISLSTCTDNSDARLIILARADY